jgi:ORF6N domain
MTEFILALPEVEKLIHEVHGKRVMLDEDLAKLYEVPTKRLRRAVRRNKERFPKDFMFSLELHEVAFLRSQIGSAKIDPRGGRRDNPYLFTQEGIAMLSSVLRSPRAIEVNIFIMRAFVRLRDLSLTHQELAAKLNELESRYDQQFKVVFDAIRGLVAEKSTPRKRIRALNQD